MSESFRATPPEQQWSGANRSSNGNGFQSSRSEYANSVDSSSEIGRALLIGVLGGLLSAAGYIIYRRLPEEQKERINSQIRSQVQQRVSEIRANFNL